MHGFRFANRKFDPKEVSIRIAFESSIFLLKPPKSYHTLTNENKKSINFVKNLTGIKFFAGNINMQEMCSIISKH